MKEDRFAEFMQAPLVGVIATLRKDGMPYTVPVWWLWQPDGIWITGTYNRVWCKQLMADPRASLCIESGRPLSGHVEFDGHVTVVHPKDADIWPMSRLLVEKYVGRNDPANDDAVEKFFDNMKTEPRLLFRLTPEVTRAIDMSVYRGKRQDREFQESGR